MPKANKAGQSTRPPATRPDFLLEEEIGGRVVGVDEVGMGPLAGPVLSAAVIFPAGVPPELALLLNDSKKLDKAKRDAAYLAIMAAAKSGIAEVGVGAASSVEIGKINILRAAQLAMRRAVSRLPSPPTFALVDGNKEPPLGCPVRCVIKGDSKSLSIAAASIVAKVLRDRIMSRLDPRWPGYGFAVHSGYPTAAHMEALARLGPSPHHRRGFGPVDQPGLFG